VSELIISVNLDPTSWLENSVASRRILSCHLGIGRSIFGNESVLQNINVAKSQVILLIFESFCCYNSV